MDKANSLKPRQIKAARALLDWSQEDLARSAGLSIATIRKLELGHISPRGKTINLLRNSFEEAGLEFLYPDGVRHCPEDIVIYQGLAGIKSFYDDVYETAKKRGGDVVIVCPNPNTFYADQKAIYPEVLGEYREAHVERMAKLKNRVNIKCIVTERPNSLSTASYAEYRLLSKRYVDCVPFYVYDNRYAISTLDIDQTPKIVLVISRSIAESFKRQFHSLWDQATPLAPIKIK